MSSRPYTAILMCGKIVKVENVMAPLMRADARRAIEANYPGYTLVTLIPGIHAEGAFVYSQEIGDFSESQRIDPFDMTYTEEMNI